MNDYRRASEDLADAIRLGYEAEQDDAHFPFDVPPDEEIRRLSDWLASEGFSRPQDWASGISRPR